MKKPFFHFLNVANILKERKLLAQMKEDMDSFIARKEYNAITLLINDSYQLTQEQAIILVKQNFTHPHVLEKHRKYFQDEAFTLISTAHFYAPEPISVNSFWDSQKNILKYVVEHDNEIGMVMLERLYELKDRITSKTPEIQQDVNVLIEIMESKNPSMIKNDTVSRLQKYNLNIPFALMENPKPSPQSKKYSL